MDASEVARVISIADDVLGLWSDHISTHYEGCYKRHAACLASLVKEILEDAL